MLDLVDPLRSDDKLLFRSQNYLLNIILRDRMIFLDHSILPFFLFCSLFIGGRFSVNDVT